MRRFHVPAMAGFAAILVLVGCTDDESSSPSSTPDAQADVTSDSSVGGAGGQEAGAAGQAGTGGETMDAAVEASPEASVPTCGDPGSAFACTPFDPATDLVAPASDCTTEQVHQFILDCWQQGTASQEKCKPWAPDGAIGATPCGICLNDWITEEGYPNNLGCIYKFVGGSDPANQTKCRNAVKCINGCGAAACNKELCDDVIADSEGKTEYERCFESDSVWGPTGTCVLPESDGASVGLTFNTCIAETSYKDSTANCRISQSHPGTIVAQIEGFFRGACRDDGDWTNVNDPKLW